MRYAGFSLMLIALASVGWLAMDQQGVADQEINANRSAIPKLEVGSPFSEEYWAYLRAMRQDELKPDLAASLLLASGTIVQISKGIEDEELLAAKHVASELERKILEPNNRLDAFSWVDKERAKYPDLVLAGWNATIENVTADGDSKFALAIRGHPNLNGNKIYITSDSVLEIWTVDSEGEIRFESMAAEQDRSPLIGAIM